MLTTNKCFLAIFFCYQLFHKPCLLMIRWLARTHEFCRHFCQEHMRAIAQPEAHWLFDSTWYQLTNRIFALIWPMMASSNGNVFRDTGLLCRDYSPKKGQWCGALMFSLICTRTNSWVNKGDAGDLRRHRPRYDVIVMPWSPRRTIRKYSR